MELWPLGLTASAIITVSFAAVGVRVALDLSETGQWAANPLAVATVFLYLSCAGSHGIRTVQLVEPMLGIASLPGLASHIEYSFAHMIGLDASAAFAGVWYWTMRRRYPSLVRGAAIFEDLRTRKRQALDVHDNVVQGLTESKLALETGQDEVAEETMERTLEEAKGMITDLLDSEHGEVTGGELRRGDR